MLTTKRLVGRVGVAAAVLLLALSAHATTTSDRSAAIVVFPKVVVDSGNSIDTIIQLTNGNESSPVEAHCFYVNATSHCSNNGLACRSGVDCDGGGACIPGWSEVDFSVVLTSDQPFYWVAGVGRNRVCANNSECEALPLQGLGFCSNVPYPCTQNTDCSLIGAGLCLGATESNAGTSVPPTPESDFFVGELKCVQVNSDGSPSSGNDLIGVATIVRVNDDTSNVDAQSYNAVGIQGISRCSDGDDDGELCESDDDCADPGSCQAQVNGDRALVLGGEAGQQEYEACPSTLILDHIFDGAPDPIDGSTVVTDLTLVPCSEDFSVGSANVGRSSAQFLVFNEFEQRFSTSRTVNCFDETLLSNIDTRNNLRSIFSINVAGTVAGQARIRPVGSGLIGVARMMRLDDTTFEDFANNLPEADVFGNGGAAYNLHQQGDRDPSLPDTIVLP